MKRWLVIYSDQDYIIFYLTAGKVTVKRQTQKGQKPQGNKELFISCSFPYFLGKHNLRKHLPLIKTVSSNICIYNYIFTVCCVLVTL